MVQDLKRLNEYRDCRVILKQDEKVMQGGALFLYEDPRMPQALADLAKTMRDTEKALIDKYSDVIDYIGAAIVDDFTVGTMMKLYYHDAEEWPQVAKKAGDGHTAEECRKMVYSYIREADV